MEKPNRPKIINSITELHRLLEIPKPVNPLITWIDHAQRRPQYALENQKLVLNFYTITIKRSFKGQLKYGKNHYDFDEGTMSFLSPKQVLTLEDHSESNTDGWSLIFHPDLIANYSLAKTIKDYGFFSYGVNEALHLSDQEEQSIENLVQNIRHEIASALDLYSQGILVSNLDLLLHYCNRFYNRQFITRKMANTDLLTSFEDLVSKYFEEREHAPLPTVKAIAEQLHVSPSYLSDMLRSLTGQNTQQHIHAKLIEKAKEYLTTTSKSIGEIAFQLGFEHAQSFNRLFKNKTSVSPTEYRNSFN